MSDHVVAPAEDLGDGDRLLVELEGRFVGVFNVDGELRAYTDWCPHQSGPVCEGTLDGTTEIRFDRETLSYDAPAVRRWVKDGEVLRCPWHAWEFDVHTGECLHDGSIRLLAHPVHVEDGQIVVSL